MTLVAVISGAACSAPGSSAGSDSASGDVTAPDAQNSDRFDDPEGNSGAGADADPDRPEASEEDSGPGPADPSPSIERDLDSFPELELDPNGPGTDAAYNELIAGLRASLTDGVDDEPPWPDLRNPDPAAAYESCSTFQNWIAMHDPNPALVSGYASPNSPEWGWDRDLFSTQRSLGWYSSEATPPYSLSIIDVVSPGASPISDALLEQVPPGSAAVVYYDSVGVSAYVDGDGNVVEENDGWFNVGPWVAIMEPTDAGWRVWWDELVDPPPGDEWDRGPQSRVEDFDRA